MNRPALLAGLLSALPFALSVALLCTTSGSDRLYYVLSVVTMLAMFGGVMALQVAVGARAFRRGAPLARPLVSVTTAYMAAVFGVLLGSDVLARIVEPGFLPAGAAATAVLWAEILGPMAAVPALSAVVVAVGVGAARARLSPR